MTVARTHELKALQSRRTEQTVAVREAERAHQEAVKGLNSARQKLAAIQQSIDALQSSEPIVTEHAMLRYLERTRKIDLDAIRNEILTPQVVSTINALRSAKIPINGKALRMVVRDRTIITIEPTDD